MPISIPKVSTETIFQESAIRFLSSIKNVPLSKLMFFTFKDNSGKYHKMDKVRKWCSRWSHHHLIVRSPVGGFHFHGLALRNDKTINYLKGIHLDIQPVGDGPRDPVIPQPGVIPYPSHPYIKDYEVSSNFMVLMRELRERFGGPRASLPDRIRSRKARMKGKLHHSRHINSIMDYLKKNFYEGAGIPYDDISIR